MFSIRYVDFARSSEISATPKGFVLSTVCNCNVHSWKHKSASIPRCAWCIYYETTENVSALMKGRQQSDSEAQTATANTPSSSVVTAFPSSLQWQRSTSSANFTSPGAVGDGESSDEENWLEEYRINLCRQMIPKSPLPNDKPSPRRRSVVLISKGHWSPKMTPTMPHHLTSISYQLGVGQQTTRLPLLKLVVTELFNFSITH